MLPVQQEEQQQQQHDQMRSSLSSCSVDDKSNQSGGRSAAMEDGGQSTARLKNGMVLLGPSHPSFLIARMSLVLPQFGLFSG
jgi:hypothetical protein